MDFDGVVDIVLEEGGFDVARSKAEGWVNEATAAVLAKSQWLMSEVSLGVTVVDDADYAIPETVVEIEGLYLADDQGQPGDWRRIGTSELWALKAGRSTISGSGGVYAVKYNAAGGRFVELYPAPETAGVNIVTLASVVPDPMEAGDPLPIPQDMHGALADGAISLGLRRIDERSDSAEVPAAIFAGMVIDLRKRKTARVGGGASRVRIAGIDA